MLKLGNIPVNQVVHKCSCEICNSRLDLGLIKVVRRVTLINICPGCLKTLNDWGQLTGYKEKKNDLE